MTDPLVKTWRCRTHVGLVAGCWHGSCRVCGKGVTAFDFSEREAAAIVRLHVESAHAPIQEKP